MPVPPSDEELACAFLEQHDERFFTELYHRHKDPLYRYLLRTAFSGADAAEIGQLAWTKLIEALGKGLYSPRQGASFKTYLYTLANNCRIDFYRSQHLRLVKDDHVSYEEEIDGGAMAEPTSDSDPAKALESKRFREAYGKALRELPEMQRVAYLLKEDGGLSVDEIAHVMGVKYETAKSYLALAREKLRAKLGEWYEN